MKKIIKLTESDLRRIIKRVISEQEFIEQEIDPILPSNPNDMYPSNPNENDPIITIGVKSKLLPKGWMNITIPKKELLLSLGMLATLGVGLVKRGISMIFRQRELKFISREISYLLNKNLTKEEINCVRSKLAKVGDIGLLDNEETTKKVRSEIGYCLANTESGITVDEFYDKLKEVVDKYDNSANYKKFVKKYNK